jgi:hypothetical protein
MSPFEAIYGRKCRTPLMWSEVGERALVGPALIKEAEERVAEIREKVEGCPIPTEELYRQEEARSKLQSRRLCLPQGFTYPRNSKISSAREVGPSIHWTIQSTEESWSSSILVGTTRGNVRYTSGVSCLPVAKVFESTRRKMSAGREN